MNDVARRWVHVSRDSRSRDDEVELQQEATNSPIINGDLEGTTRREGGVQKRERGRNELENEGGSTAPEKNKGEEVN